MTTGLTNPAPVEVLHHVVALLDHAVVRLWHLVDEDAGESLAERWHSELALGIDLARSRAAELAAQAASSGPALAGLLASNSSDVAWPSSAALALTDAGRLAKGLAQSSVRPDDVERLLDELAELLCQALSDGR